MLLKHIIVVITTYEKVLCIDVLCTKSYEVFFVFKNILKFASLGAPKMYICTKEIFKS